MKPFLTTLIAGLPLMFAATSSFAADEAAPKPYPLKTCVVSGEKLGEMGDPYVFVYQGQQIKLCCKDCLKKFNNDPEKYVKKLSEKPESKPESGHEAHAH